MSDGTVHQLNVSHGGVPKKPIDVGEVGSLGLAGDGHAKTAIHGGPDKALSLFPLEVVERLAAQGHPISPGSVGENVTTRGLAWEDVVPGTRLRLGGDLLVEVVSFAAPCTTIAGSFSDGDVSRLSQRVEPGQSRVYARVLSPGVVRPGDAIAIEARGARVDAATPEPPTSQRREGMGGIQLGYVNLYVTDLARSMEFFEKTLGLEVQFADPDFGYGSLSVGPVRMGVARVDPAAEASRGLVGRQTGFGFVVDDLVATHAELEARGVRFSMPPSKQPWGGFMAMFEDPDGNVFYLDQAQGDDAG